LDRNTVSVWNRHRPVPGAGTTTSRCR